MHFCDNVHHFWCIFGVHIIFFGCVHFLMSKLKKIKNATQKKLVNKPHEICCVLQSKGSFTHTHNFFHNFTDKPMGKILGKNAIPRAFCVLKKKKKRHNPQKRATKTNAVHADFSIISYRL